MKIIAGFIEPDSGEVEIGQTIKIGYFGQEVDIDPELRVIDYVKEAAEFVRTADGLVSASAMLERFLFPPEQQYSPVGKLSGGEKRRLYLLRVLMSAPNVLILDEPTNDLDVETLAILEDYLDGYDGIVITVSHDRYFLDRIAKRIFAFEGAGKIVQYEADTQTTWINVHSLCQEKPYQKMQRPQEQPQQAYREIQHQMIQTQKKPGRRNPWKPGAMRKSSNLPTKSKKSTRR